MSMNQIGIKMIHDATRPLHVDSMDAAQDVLAKALLERGFCTTVEDRERLARHLAWLIGFDALIGDREKVHAFTSMIVEASA